MVVPNLAHVVYVLGVKAAAIRQRKCFCVH
jgi:hypothetical protein